MLSRGNEQTGAFAVVLAVSGVQGPRRSFWELQRIWIFAAPRGCVLMSGAAFDFAFFTLHFAVTSDFLMRFTLPLIGK